MLRNHNFTPLIFFMIVGPFYTTPSDNSPWGTHISTPAKPPPSQHEVHRDWEADWIIDVPSPCWGEDRLTESRRLHKGTCRVCEEISRSGSVWRSLYHFRRVDLEPGPALLDLPVIPVFRRMIPNRLNRYWRPLQRPPSELSSWPWYRTTCPLGSFHTNHTVGHVNMSWRSFTHQCGIYCQQGRAW